MGIISINTNIPGQAGVNPRHVQIISSDSLATVTATGYLNEVVAQGYTIYETDIIDMWYSWQSNTNTGIFAYFIHSWCIM